MMIDKELCRRLGRFLGTIRFPGAREDDVPGDIPGADLRMLYFIVVAICHQTTPMGKQRLEGIVQGRFCYGWDYLRERWLGAAKADSYILNRTWLFTAQATDVIFILSDLGRASTVYDAEGRARFLRDIGSRMYRDDVEHVDEYYTKSDGRLKDRGDIAGLESLLSRFEAYGKDPVKKKLAYFLILMNRYGFWEYRDIENLGVPVDYHETRLYLRLGTVIVADRSLRAKINSGSVITSEEDVLIRGAVHGAIFEIAAASGRTPTDLHYFFWNMARNCCRRDETHCVSCGPHGSLPERYAELLYEKRCVFAENCVDGPLPHAVKTKEPLVDTDLY